MIVFQHLLQPLNNHKSQVELGFHTGAKPAAAQSVLHASICSGKEPVVTAWLTCKCEHATRFPCLWTSFDKREHLGTDIHTQTKALSCSGVDHLYPCGCCSALGYSDAGTMEKAVMTETHRMNQSVMQTASFLGSLSWAEVLTGIAAWCRLLLWKFLG